MTVKAAVTKNLQRKAVSLDFEPEPFLTNFYWGANDEKGSNIR